MNTRLQRFLNERHITQSQFAQTLGVTNASISHIISGRNKPGYDFIVSVAQHYPELNIEWLLLGEGPMYKNDIASQAPKINDDNELFPDTEISEAQPAEVHIPQEPQKTAPAAPVEDIPAPDPVKQTPAGISKVIVLYSDNTYRELD